MPPNQSDFQRMLDSVKARLAKEIKGREESDEPILKNKTDSRKHALELRKVPVNTDEGMFDFSFAVNADCPCSAIAEFLKVVTIENITLANGPKNGKVLGVNGKAIKSFYAYKI